MSTRTHQTSRYHNHRMEHPIPAKSACILVVDDDYINRALMSDCLQLAGFLVLTAEHGIEALKLIEHGREIDLLVTDFDMPRMNGGELVMRARSIIPTLPVLLTTTHAETLSLNANVLVLPKPWRPDIFIDWVKRMLNR